MLANTQRQRIEGNIKEALNLLSRCQRSLRGWEHDFLYTSLDRYQRILPSNTTARVAFSPDGQRIVSSGADITFWDASNGEEVLTLKGHTNPVASVTVSPDGKQIVSCTWDMNLSIWDASRLMQLEGP